MRAILSAATVAALITVAACNRAEESAASGNQGSAPAPGQGSGNASAPADPKAAYQVRHEGFEDIGDHLKAINRELKGGSPSVETLQSESAGLAEKARQVPGWFPAGSGPEAGTRTRAKAEIWSNNQDFQQRAQTFAQASAAFAQAAQGGNVAAIQAAMPALGDSCKQCHERYRGPER
ncbi:MAG TPA: cytochrome c [Allosphingosinicella sp.]|jgi:cytochrome c556